MERVTKFLAATFNSRVLNMVLALLLIMVLVRPSVEVKDRRVVITLGSPEAYAAGTADYSLGSTGTANNITINTALTALPTQGGLLHFKVGSYNITGNIIRAIDNVIIEGEGNGTYLFWNGSSAIFTAGGNHWVFRDLAVDSPNAINMSGYSGVWENVYDGTTNWTHREFVNGQSVLSTVNITTRLNMAGDIVPTTNATRNIGSSLLHFLTGWFTNLVVDTVNTTQLTATTANATTLNAPTGRGATYVIAGANSTALEISQADAVATGLADDVLFQSYLDLAAPSHGSVKWYGTLNITSPIILRSSWYDFTIEGDGWNSVLLANNNLNDSIIKSDDSGARIWRITLKNFRVQGNQLNQTKGDGIYLWGASFSYLDHLYILNCKGNGLSLNGSAGLQGTDIWVNNSRFDSNNGTGLYSYAYGGSDLMVSSCVMQSNTRNGLAVYNGGAHINNNQIYSNGEWGIDSNGINNSFVGNEIIENGLPNVAGGLLLRPTSDYCSISGGIIADNGAAGGGLDVQAGATHNTVTGVVFASSGTTTHGYAILEEGVTADYNTYIGNPGTIGTIKGILIQGVHSIARGNIDWVTENSGNFTITAGQWGASIAHGLATNATAVQLTLTGNTTTTVYVSFGSITSTNFTANLSALQGSDITGVWRAVIGAGN